MSELPLECTSALPNPEFCNPALVIAHPGHELRLYGWLVRHRPVIYVLTNGSGLQGASRLDASAALFADMNAPQGEMFGPLSDVEVYEALLAGDVGIFIGLLDGLAASFVRRKVDFVVGDSAEGFSPTHDVCRYLIDAAVALAQRRTGRRIANYQFKLTEWSDAGEECHDDACLHYALSDDLFAAKLAAAERNTALAREVAGAFAMHGRDYFRRECLRPAGAVLSTGCAPATPYYEEAGAARAARGDFDTVIRYETHVRPIVDALLDCAINGDLAGARTAAR